MFNSFLVSLTNCKYENPREGEKCQKFAENVILVGKLTLKNTKECPKIDNSPLPQAASRPHWTQRLAPAPRQGQPPGAQQAQLRPPPPRPSGAQSQPVSVIVHRSVWPEHHIKRVYKKECKILCRCCEVMPSMKKITHRTVSK